MPKAPVKAQKPKRKRSVRAERIGWDLRDPLTAERAIAEIAAAFTKAEGSGAEAAKLLEVGYVQVNRWVKEHAALSDRLNDIRKTYGLSDLGAPGRPWKDRV